MTPRLVFALAIALGCAGCAAETLDAGSTIARARGAPKTRATLGAMIDAIAMDETDLYFTCEDGWVYRLAKSGTAPPSRVAPAAAPGSLYTDGIAIDDAYVYWTALGDGIDGGAVLRAPKSGGPAEVLAPHEARPWSIAVDGANVVWAEQGASPPTDTLGGIGKGSIARIDKSGHGDVEVLAHGLTAPDYLAIDGDGGVVWHEALALRRLGAGSDMLETIVERPVAFKTTNLVVADGRVAWADDPAGAASVWSADATDRVTALASNVEPPAALSASGSIIFWSVATGGDVGAILGATEAGGAQTVLTRDASGDRANERALFLLADEHAFYSVVSWVSKELTVEIRVVPR